MQGIPVVQFEPMPDRTIFRTLLLADLLSGLGDSAALMATVDPLKVDVYSTSKILEIGTQALESYGLSVAFLFLQGPANEAWQMMVNQTGILDIPAGWELHFYVNAKGKASKILIPNTQS